jgi:hypothetical protein
MSVATAQLPERELTVGERIRVRQGRRPLVPDLVGQVGTIVEMFRVPQGGCLVRIDGDPDHQRECFLYRNEIVISDA